MKGLFFHETSSYGSVEYCFKQYEDDGYYKTVKKYHPINLSLSEVLEMKKDFEERFADVDTSVMRPSYYKSAERFREVLDNAEKNILDKIHPERPLQRELGKKDKTITELKEKIANLISELQKREEEIKICSEIDEKNAEKFYIGLSEALDINEKGGSGSRKKVREILSELLGMIEYDDEDDEGYYYFVE